MLRGDFVGASRDAITDPWLRDLPPVGAIDQFVDFTDVLSDPRRSRALRSLYDHLSGRPACPSEPH